MKAAIGGVEPHERGALHPTLTTEVGDEFDQGVVVADLGVPIGAENEKPLRLGRADDVAQQQQGWLGRPLQVIEHGQKRFVGRRRPQPGGDGVEQSVALRLGVGLQRGRQVRQALRQLGDQSPQLPAVTAKAPGEVLGRGVVHEVAQRLDKGLVGHAQILVTAPGEHGRPLLVDLACQLGASRVFPTPGSPARSTTRRSPAAASFHSCPSCSSSGSRPTKMRPISVSSAGSGTDDTASGCQTISQATTAAGRPWRAGR
jgi:hypothetical protein